MKLHINGEPARMFFRYTKSWLDKHGDIRQDVRKKLEKGKTFKDAAERAEYLAVHYALLTARPPNITEFYLIRGTELPPRDSEPDNFALITKGRVWWNPREKFNYEKARHAALASAIRPFSPMAKQRLMEFYEARGVVRSFIEAENSFTGEAGWIETPLDWDINLSDPSPIPREVRRKRPQPPGANVAPDLESQLEAELAAERGQDLSNDLPSGRDIEEEPE